MGIVTDDLHLDVACALDHVLEVEHGAAEGAARLATCTLGRRDDVTSASASTRRMPLAAAAGGRLEQQGIARLGCAPA